MVYICIVVHNRYTNLKHWLECWDKCNKHGADIVVIHNHSNPSPEYQKLCEKHGVRYISRPDIGYDIGAFQDICTRRLKGFPRDWQRLLWVTDDTFPMSKDFVKEFTDKMWDEVGVVCMELSPYSKMHIRTTGFMIDRRVAEHLVFPADPIISKQHCYLFEHRDAVNTFKQQVERMGLKVVQVAPANASPLWDSGYHRRIERRGEHAKLFGSHMDVTSAPVEPLITFVCPIYNSFPVIITSLMMQTNPRWKLILIHNGPDSGDVEDVVNKFNDYRVEYTQTPTHTGNYGHAIRAEYLQKVKSEFVVITNPDNYYVPSFIEYMLASFRPDTVGVYCGQMVHSYVHWGVIECSLKRGYIDCGNMVLRTQLAKSVGWNNIIDHSADWLFFNDLIKAYGIRRFVKRVGALFIHN